MRKVVSLMHISLDGMDEGPAGPMDIGWVGYTKELQEYIYHMHNRTDAVIYGRVSFEMMENYFPSMLDQPEDSEDGDVRHAHWLDKATKYVFSRTVDHFNWRNTIVIHDNMAEEINRIKAQPGKDIWLLASPTIHQEFMNLGLIDELILTLNPVVLGGGKSYFANLTTGLNLKLLSSKTMENGVVVLHYAPDTAQAK